MGIPMVGGRQLADTDRETRPRVAVVNQALARLLAGGASPIGRRIVLEDAEVEIVGVAGDARFSSLRDAAPATIYLPFRQYAQHRMTFVMRITATLA